MTHLVDSSFPTRYYDVIVKFTQFHQCPGGLFESNSIIKVPNDFESPFSFSDKKREWLSKGPDKGESGLMF